MKCENCSGDYLANCANCHECFEATECQDCKFCDSNKSSKDAYDVLGHGQRAELILETVATGIGQMIAFCVLSADLNNVFYSISCHSCSNLFGCAGLRKKQYCIFNKQYSKEEYEQLVPQMIEHMRQSHEWGEFFNPKTSHFGYNETLAIEYFPLAREEALKDGFNWSDYLAPKPQVEQMIPASKLPETIAEVPDRILDWAIECEVTSKPFRIVKQELDFYRKMNISLPRRHPDQRHHDRLVWRNPRKLWVRKCDKCGVEIKTTYGLDRQEKIFCEECYQKAIF
ncbi:MAG: hypothetical protein NTZ80_00735 [Patescibacteria group bacterium]|nr:hypothetical protein [Patescibacteria group bacterium]